MPFFKTDGSAIAEVIIFVVAATANIVVILKLVMYYSFSVI